MTHPKKCQFLGALKLLKNRANTNKYLILTKPYQAQRVMGGL
jgi:hypothetical protein